jgi:acetyl esterase/lipase
MTVSGRPPEPSTEPSQANSTIPATAIPEGISAQLDVAYAQYGPRKVLADLFIPQSPAGPKPAIVVVHGGGWLNGDKSKFRALAIRLAQQGFVTAAIEYRLGGEAKFPAGIHDCNAAVRFLRANAQQYSIDPDRIAAVGGSAGGHLVGLMATGWKDDQLQGDGGHSNVSSELQAAIVMAGPMQIATGSVAEKSRTGSKGSNAIQWIGRTIDDAKDMYLMADAYERISSDTCPLLFMTGEHDNPERNAPSRDRLQQAGVVTGIKIYKDGKHGCWNRQPWFDEMASDIAAWLHEQMPEAK